jgi:hypothetical protein
MATISVARDGVEICNIDLAMVKAGLKSGFLLATDIGWFDGMAEWLPLPKIVLSLKPESKSVPKINFASDRQREYLSNLGVKNLPESTTRDEASILIKSALEQEKLAGYGNQQDAQLHRYEIEQSKLPDAPDRPELPVGKFNICKNYRDLGVFDIDDIRKMIEAGELSTSDYFFDDESMGWTELEVHPDLMDA